MSYQTVSNNLKNVTRWESPMGYINISNMASVLLLNATGLNTTQGFSSTGTSVSDWLSWDGTKWISGLSTNNTVHIGNNAGYNSQGIGSIAIGYKSGYSNQASKSIAIGGFAGQFIQGQESIAIGTAAGNFNQNNKTIAIGFAAGSTGQSTYCIAMGNYAGSNYQNKNSIAIGNYAGNISQGEESIAIGKYSGYNLQNSGCISIGLKSGFYSQNSNSISIGNYAGYTNQSLNSIAIGYAAGCTGQNSGAIAIGYRSGGLSQGTCSISIGYNDTVQDVKYINQYGIHIGYDNRFDLGGGNNSILIGNGILPFNTNDIIVLKTNKLTPSIFYESNAFYVDPIRDNNNTYNNNSTGTLVYNQFTKEVSYTTSKSFIIDHPLDPQNKHLVHVCLEGPEAGVYYRGREIITSKYKDVSLPDYVKALATDFTVNANVVQKELVEDIDDFPIVRVSDVIDNKFRVYVSKPCEITWIVFGKRHSITTEILKVDVEVCGDGPYKYIKSIQK